MVNKLCPYPGLRPFNEEESIFFKGREEHIDKIISQLQEKKFLMVTGASGDGKSSLIYAGLIPRSRAGFFKARYNNWLVADLRPEKAPLSNLASSLNSHLKLSDVNDLEEDLSYGFSSLVKVYKESKFFLDTNSPSFKNANDEEKQELKNKSANLLILIDQFEELFTNSENLSNGKASRQAITLINLIIETTKIAEKEDLPIYIVCTMRSDYVGDCAIFKGLPELIVYSQFFVPRLKRQEIHRAIAEPAKLSGNKINNRLIERLINELGDGQDQLPILQHSLNRIWKTHVDDNAVEMDVLHYAKVGGCDVSILPEEQKKMFAEWYMTQPVYKQKILENACMANVLNAHARELFETAVEHCRANTGIDITKEDATAQLKTIFTCLTKINDNRAVRNRSSIHEIKQIVGSGIDNKLIEGLVNIYREPGNTLLRPFIVAGGININLKDNDILDITHESLIRNWKELTSWTQEEHENVLVLADFKKQVDRWEENNRSKDYLLTIGPLSYFKEWQNKLKPNPYLFAKFDERNISFELKIKKAEQFILQGENLISFSESNIKRKRKAAVSIAAAVILVLIGFTSWAFMERGTALDQKEIANQKTKEAIVFGEKAQNSEKVALAAKNNALVLKDEAIKSEKVALTAKQLAEKAKQEALTAKGIAESEKRNAQQQTEVAKKEKENANKQTEIASKEKKRAEDSEKDAKKSLMLSVAQSIALKSGMYKDDAQLQSLLALQAYKFNKENNTSDRDPIIYNAMRNAINSANKNKGTVINGYEEYRALSDDGDSIVFGGRTGTIYKAVSKNTDKLYYRAFLGMPTSSRDVMQFSKSGKRLASSLDDHSIDIQYLSYKTRKQAAAQNLKGHRGVVRGMSFSEDETLFAAGGKDSMVLVWKFISGIAELKNSFYSNSSVKSFLFSSDGSLLYSLHENGKVFIYDLESGSNNEFEFYASSKPNSFCLNRKTETLIVGLVNGNVWIQNKKGEEPIEIKANSTPVEFIACSKDYSQFVTTSSDKKIKVFMISAPDENPLSIDDLGTKVKCVDFLADGNLVVGCTDKRIHIYQTTSKKLSDELTSIIKRNMTNVEWKKFCKGISYEKTIESLP